ncbi:Uncharacterised protein [Chlamydia trachomatis]|nr:Uncharacterised protein [Chlamydia trachomatis]
MNFEAKDAQQLECACCLLNFVFSAVKRKCVFMKALDANLNFCSAKAANFTQVIAGDGVGARFNHKPHNAMRAAFIAFVQVKYARKRRLLAFAYSYPCA